MRWSNGYFLHHTDHSCKSPPKLDSIYAFCRCDTQTLPQTPGAELPHQGLGFHGPQPWTTPMMSPLWGQSVQVKVRAPPDHKGTGKRIPHVSFVTKVAEFPAQIITCPSLSVLVPDQIILLPGLRHWPSILNLLWICKSFLIQFYCNLVAQNIFWICKFYLLPIWRPREYLGVCNNFDCNGNSHRV